MTRYAWLPLRVVDKFDPLMHQQGVSKVARGVQPSNQTKEGFLEAYRVVKGNSGKMKNRYTGYGDEVWSQRRSHFIGRHLKQMKRDKNSSGWTKDGMPTRRHLGLIAWAYSPTPTRTKAWIQKNPAKEKEMSRTYSLGTTILHSGPSNDLLEAIIKDQTIGYESFGTGVPVDPRLYGPQYVGQRTSWTPKQLESVHIGLGRWKQNEIEHFREFVERDDFSWDDYQKRASVAKHTKLLDEAIDATGPPLRNPRFRKGQRVKEKGRKGTVVALHTPGTADIRFDDMDFEIRRPIKKIQNPQTEDTMATSISRNTLRGNRSRVSKKKLDYKVADFLRQKRVHDEQQEWFAKKHSWWVVEPWWDDTPHHQLVDMAEGGGGGGEHYDDDGPQSTVREVYYPDWTNSDFKILLKRIGSPYWASALKEARRSKAGKASAKKPWYRFNPSESKWSYGGTEQWKGRTVHLVMYYDGIKKRYYNKDKAHRYLKDRWAEEMGRRPR